MQRDTRLLFPDESNQVLNAIQGFSLNNLKKTPGPSTTTTFTTATAADTADTRGANEGSGVNEVHDPNEASVHLASNAGEGASLSSEPPKPSSGLLGSIAGFSKDELKHTETVVRNLPVVTSAAPSALLTQIQGKPLVKVPSGKKYLRGSVAQMHGRVGKAEWLPPEMVYECSELARAGYDDSTTSDEYAEQPSTLAAKITVLAGLIRASKLCTAYTGAGISRAAGIADYATKDKDKDEDSKGGPPKVKSPYDAQPTLAHCVLTALHQHGFLKHWVQQNHDGLPQNAGFPQHAMNEIHG